MRIITQAIVWIAGPALATLLVIATWHASTTYQAVNLGHAVQSHTGCVPDPDEFFNACADLDASQVIDLRTSHITTELEIP